MQATEKSSHLNHLSDFDCDRIIGMAWEDRTPFEAIRTQFGLSEAEVIRLMRRELLPGSFRLWRTRVNQKVSTKHQKRSSGRGLRFKSRMQREISLNKMPKRR